MNIGTFSERSHLVYRESVKESTRYLSYKTELDVSSEGPSSGIVPNDIFCFIAVHLYSLLRLLVIHYQDWLRLEVCHLVNSNGRAHESDDTIYVFVACIGYFVCIINWMYFTCSGADMTKNSTTLVESH